MKLISTLLFAVFLTGCAVVEINSAMSSYKEVAQKVDLGDSKEDVLNILLPTQKDLSPKYAKSPEKYLSGNDLVEIYYMRSGLVSDDLTTDDEFTPYIFNNGKLVGIGWASLGGPKTHGQVTASGRSGGSGMSFLCKDAIAKGNSGGIQVHCN